MTPNPWTPELDNQLRGLWALGRSGGQISSEMAAFSRSAVLARARQLDLARRAPASPMKGRKRSDTRAVARLAVALDPTLTVEPERMEAERRRQLRQRDAKKRWPMLPTPKPGRTLPAAPTTAAAVTLMNLPAYGACKFPVGEASGVAQLFCAAPVDSLYLRYCDCHCRVAYLPSPTRRGATPNPAFTPAANGAP